MADNERFVEKEYDVVIVGAGPAGCSTAIFTAQQGCNVLLLDKSVFPRDKICGDGVSGSSLTILERMGVLEAIKEIEPWNIQNVLISSPSGDTIKVATPYKKGGVDGGYVIPREILDHLVVQHVKGIENIDFRENVTVSGLIYDGDRVSGVTAQTPDGAVGFRGKYVIGADGAYSVVAKELSLFNDVPKHRAFAVRAYFDNVAELDDTIELYYDTAVIPGYGWIFPTSKSGANVGVIVFNRFNETRGITKLFDAFITSNSSAKRKLQDAVMVEKTFKGWPLQYGPFPSRRSKGNVLLVGDGGSFIDPLTGEGIYYALKTGEFAAEAIAETIGSGHSPEKAGVLFEKKWKKSFKWKEYKPGYIFQTFNRSRRILDFAIKRARKHPKKAQVLAAAVGHYLPKSKLFFNL